MVDTTQQTGPLGVATGRVAAGAGGRGVSVTAEHSCAATRFRGYWLRVFVGGEHSAAAASIVYDGCGLRFVRGEHSAAGASAGLSLVYGLRSFGLSEKRHFESDWDLFGTKMVVVYCLWKLN